MSVCDINDSYKVCLYQSSINLLKKTRREKDLEMWLGMLSFKKMM